MEGSMSGWAICHVLPNRVGFPITLYSTLLLTLSLIHLIPWNHTRAIEPVPSLKVASRRAERPEVTVCISCICPLNTR